MLCLLAKAWLSPGSSWHDLRVKRQCGGGQGEGYVKSDLAVAPVGQVRSCPCCLLPCCSEQTSSRPLQASPAAPESTESSPWRLGGFSSAARLPTWRAERVTVLCGGSRPESVSRQGPKRLGKEGLDLHSPCDGWGWGWGWGWGRDRTLIAKANYSYFRETG